VERRWLTVLASTRCFRNWAAWICTHTYRRLSQIVHGEPDALKCVLRTQVRDGDLILRGVFFGDYFSERSWAEPLFAAAFGITISAKYLLKRIGASASDRSDLEACFELFSGAVSELLGTQAELKREP
jgi:hypothetical protein